MKLLLAIFSSLLGLASHASNGCRVLEQPIGWSVSRTMPAAPEGSTDATFDLCGYFEFLFSFENRNVLGPAQCRFTGGAVRMQASFFPDFHDVLIDTTVNFRTVVLTEPAFDGTDDFGGGSGVVVPLEADRLVHVNAHLDNPEFFTSGPWTIYLRSFAPNTFLIQGQGAYSAAADGNSAAGFTATYTANGAL